MSVKGKVLEILIKKKGMCITGKDISKVLDIPLTVVLNAMDLLKDEGHLIFNDSSLGFYLDERSDCLSEDIIMMNLLEGDCDFPVTVLKTIDSTNNEAKRMVKAGAVEGTCIIAEEQTSGRGRYGKSFYSPPNSGIYLTIILYPKIKLDEAQLITAAMAVAACKAIKKLTGIELKIKWVNDLYLEGKKIGGILTESVAGFESVVVGIGINCISRIEEFPEDIRDIAGSLDLKGISRNALATEIIKEVKNYMGDFADKRIIEEYRKSSLMIGKEIAYRKNDVEYDGLVLDINDIGNLVVRREDGKIDTLVSGEVVLKNINATKSKVDGFK